MQCVEHCDVVGRIVTFNQPVLQTLQMFVGEMLCWLPVLYMNFKARNDNRIRLNVEQPLNGKQQIKSFKDSFLLALPSICDLLATTLMNVGMLYTPVSIYQMTRGSIILIVGLLSVIFLKRRITKLEWVSLSVVSLGVFLVGLSGYLDDKAKISGNDSAENIILGMALIFAGIVLSASQFVIEEHILTRLEVEPMVLVGYEGFYGASCTLIAMIVAHFCYGRWTTGPFNIVKGFYQMFDNNTILLTSLAIMLSISSFNFCGISLTSNLNATARSTIDTCRTLLVWIISMLLHWESFHSLQLFAFFLLVVGTFAFNGVIQPESWDFIPNWLKDLETHEHN